jgi:CDP-glycerol glycerophosphotransferase (TagB/SpsB family)
VGQGFSTHPKTKQVQAFHGVSSKNVKFNPWMTEYDLLLLPGKRERDKFAAMGVLDKVQHALIGHPKADRVLRGELTREAARAQLQLPERPTILYAPTHGALSSFYKWGLRICQSVPSECNLIVKPHPSLLTTIASDKSGAEAIFAVTEHIKARGGMWIPFEPDVMPAMAASDMLVTDYSSVAEEYLVFDRPLAFADHLANASGRDRAQRDKGDWEGIFGCGTVVTQVDAVREAIDNSLRRPNEYSQARHKVRDYVFENLDGHCARRAAEAIRSLV